MEKIDHIEIVVKDIPLCLDFYINKLSFSLLSRYNLASPHFEEAAFIQHNEVRIELLKARDSLVTTEPARIFGIRLPAFEVQDMGVTLDSLERQGITPSWRLKNLGDSIRAEIKDIEGNLIELRQWIT